MVKMQLQNKIDNSAGVFIPNCLIQDIKFNLILQSIPMYLRDTCILYLINKKTKKNPKNPNIDTVIVNETNDKTKIKW